MDDRTPPGERGTGTANARGLLLHACCGPCATHCVQVARQRGYEPTLFYANDNLATEAEFARRRDTLEAFARRAGVRVVVAPRDHAAWRAAIAGLEDAPEGGRRCAICFRHNLARAADHAARAGLGVFTTTLSVSPHKRTAQLFAAGHAAERAGGRFLECDFKRGGGYARSVALAREHGLYRQNFCGCEFSAAARAGDREQG